MFKAPWTVSRRSPNPLQHQSCSPISATLARTTPTTCTGTPPLPDTQERRQTLKRVQPTPTKSHGHRAANQTCRHDCYGKPSRHLHVATDGTPSERRSRNHLCNLSIINGFVTRVVFQPHSICRFCLSSSTPYDAKCVCTSNATQSQSSDHGC